MVPGSDLIFSGLPSRLWLWGGLVCGSYLVGYWLTDALPHLLHPNTPLENNSGRSDNFHRFS
jgi:hypothetical protein|uniref:Uncharacterized protein n=1 Tax=Mus musculus TaxID=10090 RepID=Q3TZ71_MOUSE|nr:unnamed protein product [Mus musculus]